ncbi:hypothetical protein F4824DRAFT_461782 [Ustulina deusta]|nr:hypothetical protein F4824DRAFT_461782 [Ustulina deusta]
MNTYWIHLWLTYGHLFLLAAYISSGRLHSGYPGLPVVVIRGTASSRHLRRRVELTMSRSGNSILGGLARSFVFLCVLSL